MKTMRTFWILTAILALVALVTGCGPRSQTGQQVGEAPGYDMDRRTEVPTAVTTGADDAFAELRDDHRAVQDLIEQAATQTDQAQRAATIAQIRQALLPHMAAEEKVLYPVLQGAQRPEDRVLGVAAAEEHQAARDVLNKLEQGNLSQEQYAAQLTLLRDMINTHVQREEEQLFDVVNNMYTDEQRAQLRQNIIAEKQRAMSGTMQTPSRTHTPGQQPMPMQ